MFCFLPSFCSNLEKKQVNYNCRVLFLDIQNVHKVRDSHDALLSQFYPEEADLSASTQHLEEMLPSGPSSNEMAADGWMLTVSKLLDGALKISKSLKEGWCVCVHCRFVAVFFVSSVFS